MMPLPSSVRVYLATEPTDMRRGFNGLASIVEGHFGYEITSGHLFVFINRRGDQVKLIFFDRTGLCVLHKRLERGTFRRVRDAQHGETHVEVDAAELGLMLEGIDLGSAKRRKRLRIPPSSLG